MSQYRTLVIRAHGVRSLCWQGDTLVDWVAGGTRYLLDGTGVPQRVNYAYWFDHAVVSPSGRYAAILERLGTKGLLLDQGKIIREINRSFYHAHVYEFPIALFALPDGAEVMAHCPDEYNRIEIEEIATGKRLTESRTRDPADFFHSRLRANRAGTYLLSAGWVWHPWDAIVFFNVLDALKDPASLDRLDQSPAGSRNVCLAEQSSACFLDDGHILVASSAEEEDVEEAKEYPRTRLLPRSVACYDLRSCACQWNTRLKSPAGTMMPVGAGHMVDFYEHPKLIDLTTGEIVHSWSDLSSGQQMSSVIWGGVQLPPLALDPEHGRFAVADPEKITIVQIDRNPM